MNTYELWIFRGVGLLVMFIAQDYLRLRFTMSEKYVLKDDCAIDRKVCKKEIDSAMNNNREDHRIIDQKLDKISDQLFEIVKGINKINGGK